MRAWAKRMIWFFGWWLLSDLDLYLNILRGKQFSSISAFIDLLILVIPLLMFEDDKKVKNE